MGLLAVMEALPTHCYHYNELSSARRGLRGRESYTQYDHTNARGGGRGGGGRSFVVEFIRRLVSVQLLHAVMTTHSLYLERHHLPDKQCEF